MATNAVQKSCRRNWRVVRECHHLRKKCLVVTTELAGLTLRWSARNVLAVIVIRHPIHISEASRLDKRSHCKIDGLVSDILPRLWRDCLGQKWMETYQRWRKSDCLRLIVVRGLKSLLIPSRFIDAGNSIGSSRPCQRTSLQVLVFHGRWNAD